MNELFGCVVYLLTALHFAAHFTRASCDLKEANDCLNKAAGGGCVSIIDSGFVTEEAGRCRSEYVDACTTFAMDVWLQALPAVIDGLKDECSPGCVNASIQLRNCRYYMYSGLKQLANDVVTRRASPSDVQCNVGLMRIYQCIVDAVSKCESLEYYALSALRSEEKAFTLCNITFTKLISHNISEEYNNKTTDPPSEYTSLKMVLLAGVAVAGIIVIVAGSFIMYMWIHKIRQSNFRKTEMRSDTAAYSFDSNTGETGRSWRTRRYLRSDSEDRSWDSMRSGQAPWNRWWTRPGFGTYGKDIQNFGI